MDNKQLVNKFYEEVFKNGDLSNIDTFMKNDYIQHSPEVKNGKAGFIEFIKLFLKLEPKINILNISSDNDYVYVFFKCDLNNGHTNKVCDIYRISDNKLAEHWDIIEKNIEDVKTASGNPLF
ncbi:ester cyclase [Apilactobacillus apisilvae]|uniref:Ester cyclase n=1 Tax=Apilactobacillus apisilvae TaxID=2923364 RepID=A0ABY4PH61_9LACO|nr:ester cyclase [Apilactobacillus apisilvae]UQS85129.1 ester cyclase [Apilactobacillus apisilvae]